MLAHVLGGDAVLRARLIAHQGGWDELVFVLVPIALFGVLLAIANRRAARLEDEREAEEDDDG